MSKVIGLLLPILITIIVSALFIMLGWSLFVVPVFGLESLTFFQAFGFGLLASSFKNASSGDIARIKKILEN